MFFNVDDNANVNLSFAMYALSLFKGDADAEY